MHKDNLIALYTIIWQLPYKVTSFPTALPYILDLDELSLLLFHISSIAPAPLVCSLLSCSNIHVACTILTSPLFFLRASLCPAPGPF